jgi:hypothetical protein
MDLIMAHTSLLLVATDPGKSLPKALRWMSTSLQTGPVPAQLIISRPIRATSLSLA